MLTVSTAELDRLGRELRAAAAAIVAHSRNDLGAQLEHDGPVSTALRSVERDWSKQRGAIVDYLDKVGQGARAAADLYAAIEREIVTASRPGPVVVRTPSGRSGT